MLEFRITKKELLENINNEMVSGYYHLIHMRLYNEDLTKYKKCKFVLWTEYFDIQEYFEIESFTKKDLNEYLNEITSSLISSYANNWDNLEELYTVCNDTIVDYNKRKNC